MVRDKYPGISYNEIPLVKSPLELITFLDRVGLLNIFYGNRGVDSWYEMSNETRIILAWKLLHKRLLQR